MSRSPGSTTATSVPLASRSRRVFKNAVVASIVVVLGVAISLGRGSSVAPAMYVSVERLAFSRFAL